MEHKLSYELIETRDNAMRNARETVDNEIPAGLYTSEALRAAEYWRLASAAEGRSIGVVAF